MKKTLNKSFIINKLSISVKPALNDRGKVVCEPNPQQKPYIVFDVHRDSPVGFGVKVSLTKKTYVIQRRVSSGDRSVSEGNKPSSVLKVKVRNVSDFPGIDQKLCLGIILRPYRMLSLKAWGRLRNIQLLTCLIRMLPVSQPF